MRSKKTAWMLLPALGFFLLFNGCKKATSVDAVQQRLDWNLKTLVDPYEHAGHADPAWNGSAKRALTEFARLRSEAVASNEPATLIISTNVTDAVEAGCNDPMIEYLFIRFGMNQT